MDAALRTNHWLQASASTSDASRGNKFNNLFRILFCICENLFQWKCNLEQAEYYLEFRQYSRSHSSTFSPCSAAISFALVKY